MKEYIIYEQPVAENIRNFLKCEYLFEKFNSALLQEDLWGVKSSISTLLEMSDFIMRINLKVELLKDLEKCMLYFNNLTKNNDVDAIVLDDFISKIEEAINMLNNINGNPSKLIVDNDFLMQINNKIHIPAGDNFFDMPSYLNFLSSSKSSILEHINMWYEPFSPLILASKLILNARRDTTDFVPYTSSKSYFEKKLDKSSRVDLVRIKLLKKDNLYPVISVNRQNINVIFKTSYGKNKLSKPIIENNEFSLSLSGLK
jgi:cell division protein ZapD